MKDVDHSRAGQMVGLEAESETYTRQMSNLYFSENT
jgi:hypothetical protein